MKTIKPMNTPDPITTISQPELLAPAGTWSSLLTAVENGADAVYFGIKKLNMRDKAGNFEVNELPKIMRYLHEHNKKGYLTLNTIYYNSELKKLKTVIAAAKDAGVDAVICWDMAVLSLAKKTGMPIHLSTQASVSNYQAFTFYADLGVERIILARECSLEAIADINGQARRDGLRCEIETFVHGAMYVSISGRCFLSADTFGKSANRGQCLQPCRRLFKITDLEGESHEYELGRDYVLSPRDLCSIEILPELIEAGISSFKIEGRIRPPDYVKTTVSCYRKALDAIAAGEYTPELSAGLKEELAKTFNRGFSRGFYHGLEENWISRGLSATELKVYCGDVVNYYKKIQVAECALRSHPLTPGDKILIHGKTTPAQTSVITELQINYQTVPTAKKGERCGFKVPFIVRPGDKVFKLIDTDRDS